MEAISQRDLRMRSREIMDSVEAGQRFTVSRGGHDIAELIPLRRPRRFVTREDFAASSSQYPRLDLAQFRADVEAIADPDEFDRYEQ
jgi:antitoxin (DNA-binding transcriptional repressor) of toxin-antitoxin stability system